jgi:hypothetical protein
MKACCGLVLALVVLTTTGCATLFGEGGQPVWTYNFQQSLARSGGDVAMTMLLDQGCPKAKAVEVVNVLIRIVESNVSRKEIEAELDAQVALLPAIAGIVDKLKKVVPASVGGTDKIPAEVKDILLSFLKDGALYGASLYKEANREVKVKGNEKVKPEIR